MESGEFCARNVKHLVDLGLKQLLFLHLWMIRSVVGGRGPDLKDCAETDKMLCVSIK